jgi:hypothetical protein
MALQADRKYNGTIAANSALCESQTGTMSFNINIECDGEETQFPIWLTEKNRAKATKYFEIIGADMAKLSSQAYLEYELPVNIVGKEISFGTKDDEYNGKKRVKVAWIGKKTDPNLARGAASFFGGAPATADTGHDRPIDDTDIPF